MSAELVYEGNGQRISYTLEKDEVTIGRSPDNDVIINDGVVSRHHAMVYRAGSAWRVKDLGSSNGTRLNGREEIDRDLRDGDRINIHKFQVRFVDRAAPAFSLTPSADGEPLAAQGTVYRSAIDFNALATAQHQQTLGAPQAGVDRLGRLLDIVTKASEALLSSTSLDETLSTVLDLVFEHLNVERGCIMLWDEDKQELAVQCVRQKTGSSGDETEIRFSRTIAEKVYREKVAVLTSDAQSDARFAGGESIVALGIRSAMAAPLWSGDRVEGLIYADTPLRVKAFDDFDLDVLSALGNHAAVAIQQSRLQNSIMEQQLVRQRLERYHSPAVIEHITAQGTEAQVAHEMDVTVMFADVVGFTQRCESMQPRKIAELLNRYFSEMAEVVFRHEGTLDKFIGDCLMAVFGAPMTAEDHARRALEAALDMRSALDALNEPLPFESRLTFRVGVHSGLVVAGDIGSIRRSDYTVLGSTVNLAARLESSVAEPGQIVISDSTHEAAGREYETRPVGKFQPKGISRPVKCYELLGRKS